MRVYRTRPPHPPTPTDSRPPHRLWSLRPRAGRSPARAASLQVPARADLHSPSSVTIPDGQPFHHWASAAKSSSLLILPSAAGLAGPCPGPALSARPSEPLDPRAVKPVSASASPSGPWASQGHELCHLHLQRPGRVPCGLPTREPLSPWASRDGQRWGASVMQSFIVLKWLQVLGSASRGHAFPLPSTWTYTELTPWAKHGLVPGAIEMSKIQSSGPPAQPVDLSLGCSPSQRDRLTKRIPPPF